MIRVLLVDDDPACRDALRQLLSMAHDLEIVGEARDGEEACQIGRRLMPDVVVIDADLPSAACLEAMTRLSGAPGRTSQQPSFVCLAVYPDQHDAALQLGAYGFLRKDGPPRELLAAVREAARARQARQQPH